MKQLIALLSLIPTLLFGQATSDPAGSQHVMKTDTFNGTTGVAGANNGTVPDDGAASSGRFFKDDGTWDFPVACCTITGSGTSGMGAKFTGKNTIGNSAWTETCSQVSIEACGMTTFQVTTDFGCFGTFFIFQCQTFFEIGKGCGGAVVIPCDGVIGGNRFTTFGTGYANGCHTNISTTAAGLGTGLTLDFTVAGGSIVPCSVDVNASGSAYQFQLCQTITIDGLASCTDAVFFLPDDKRFGFALNTNSTGNDDLFNDIYIGENKFYDKATSDTESGAVFIASQNGVIKAGVTNSPILGGDTITATLDDTAYVGQLAITKNNAGGYGVIRLPSGGIGGTDIFYDAPATAGQLALVSQLTNLYNANGSLTSARTITLNCFDLNTTGTGSMLIDPTGNLQMLSRGGFAKYGTLSGSGAVSLKATGSGNLDIGTGSGLIEIQTCGKIFHYSGPAGMISESCGDFSFEVFPCATGGDFLVISDNFNINACGNATITGTFGATNFSGSSSGANTGDQTITLTGGVTGSGTGSFAATVITNANLTGHVISTGNATLLGSFTVAQLSTALSDATLSGNNTGDEVSATASVEGIVLALPTGSTTTVGTATSAVDTITLATDDSSYLVTVYVTTEEDNNTNGATWIKTVHITKRTGTVVIQDETSTYFNTTTGGGGALTAGSVTVTVNVGNADIDVTGRAGTNLQWNSTYDIKTLSTN